MEGDKKEDSSLKDLVAVEHVDWNALAVLADVSHVMEEAETTEQHPVVVSSDETEIAKKHKIFKEFCRVQVFEEAKGWDTRKPLPWKVDSRLHVITSENQISKKQAAVWWMQLRRSHGRVDSVTFEGTTIADVRRNYNTFCCGNVLDTIVASAVRDCTERFEELVQDDHEFKMIFEVVFGTNNKEKVREVVCNRVEEYNETMAKQIVGMSAENLTERIAKFMKWWQKSIHTCFLRDCYRVYQKVTRSESSNHIFVCLENDVYKAWNKTMNSMLLPELVTVVDEKHLEKVVMNAGGLLYYIAGWLLLQLHKFPSKKGRESQAVAVIDYNSLDVEESKSLSVLPTGILKTREKHHGKLTRVTSVFYRFVEILEAIYKENLENPQVVWALKENLFPRLLKVTKQSFQVESAYEKCHPPYMSSGEPIVEEDKAAIMNFLLEKYNSMRAGDYIKKLKLKATANSENDDNFSVRSALVAAHLMAKGLTPTAIQKH